MKQLDEWKFVFDLVSTEPGGSIPFEVAEELQVQVVPSWLHERDYTFGGGFGELSPGHWSYSFGICITEDGQLIPEEHAAQLLAVIRQYAAKHGAQVVGGYREFTPEELEGSF